MHSYYKSQAEALDVAISDAFNRGFKAEEFFPEHVAYETTQKYHLELTSRETQKQVRKMLHITLYRMPSGNYELTHYVS